MDTHITRIRPADYICVRRKKLKLIPALQGFNNLTHSPKVYAKTRLLSFSPDLILFAFLVWCDLLPAPATPIIVSSGDCVQCTLHYIVSGPRTPQIPHKRLQYYPYSDSQSIWLLFCAVLSVCFAWRILSPSVNFPSLTFIWHKYKQVIKLFSRPADNNSVQWSSHISIPPRSQQYLRPHLTRRPRKTPKR